MLVDDVRGEFEMVESECCVKLVDLIVGKECASKFCRMILIGEECRKWLDLIIGILLLALIVKFCGMMLDGEECRTWLVALVIGIDCMLE